MRRAKAWSLFAAATLGAAGCRLGNRQVVVSELRAREEDVRTLREDLHRSEFHNQVLVRELSALRGVPGPNGVVEAPSDPYPVRSLVLGNRTEGRRSETLGGDDALVVQLEPRDPQGQAIKAPGIARVEAWEVSPEGLKTPLAVWDVPREALRANWQNGLFSTGYVLTLGFKRYPREEKLRVTARFQMVNGRTFEADKDVPVRPIPEAKRLVLPPPLPGEPPLLKDSPPLPKVEPKEKLPPPTEEKGIEKAKEKTEVLPPPPPFLDGDKEKPKDKPKEKPKEDGPVLTNGEGPSATLLRPVPAGPNGK